jgi:hypothetical protein
MKERVLNPYWGKLPPDKIAEGMNVARANAARLASDAHMMFEARRYETDARGGAGFWSAHPRCAPEVSRPIGSHDVQAAAYMRTLIIKQPYGKRTT